MSSPLWATGGLREALGAAGDDLITAADQALNVIDFEAVARKNLPPAHFGYMATGVDDDATVLANRENFSRYKLQMRRLVAVKDVSMSVSLFGTDWDSPI